MESWGWCPWGLGMSGQRDLGLGWQVINFRAERESSEGFLDLVVRRMLSLIPELNTPAGGRAGGAVGALCLPARPWAHLATRRVRKHERGENQNHPQGPSGGGCQLASVSKAEHLGFLLLPEGKAPVDVATDVFIVEATPLGT